ncbi:hypothetical protein Q5P01_020233 [Channa striata]|uniref:Uncharacterized protein n=1 Tax=Channa striata TaxID=64152 RepID=A0AA88LXZ5_CHASR|nr:hypothetical protein Q5P01_020233 [Channa striata]
MSKTDGRVSHMGNTVVVAPEAVLPIVNKHFERISTEQWGMLATANCDPATEATLSDMITEIVETLTIAVVSCIIPEFRKHLSWSTSRDDGIAAYENFNINLGSCFSDSFASALNIPQESCESTEKLTELVEREVSQKVNSVLSEVTDDSSGSSEPAVYCFNSMSLHQMVNHAITSLRRLSLNTVCCGGVTEDKVLEEVIGLTSKSIQSPQMKNSKISVSSATKAVSDILMKWSNETQKKAEEAEDEYESLSLKSDEAAAEIVTAIVDDLHKADSADVVECTDSPPKPPFNRGLIFNKVRDFFAAPTEEKTSDTEQKSRFSKFAQEQFEKTMTDVKSTFRRKKKQDMDAEDENILPGAVPPSHKSTSEATSTKVMSVNVEAITLDTDSLFKKLNQTKESLPYDSRSERILMVTGEIKKFSKDLTDTTYNQLIASEPLEFPIASAGTDSLRPDLRKDFASHEVLYTDIEDAVDKFVQKVLLWLEKESSDNTNYSKELSGALNDIEDVIRNMMPPPGLHCAAFQIKIHVDNQILNNLASVDCSDACYMSTPKSPEGGPSSCLEKKGNGLLSVSVESPRSVNLTEKLVTALLMGIILEVSRKTRSAVQSADINVIIARLSDKVREELDIHGSTVRKIQKKMKKINMPLVKDLTKEFGSSKNLLKAAMALNDTSFDDAVLSHTNHPISARLVGFLLLLPFFASCPIAQIRPICGANLDLCSSKRCCGE